jgi:hypothetical protein
MLELFNFANIEQTGWAFCFNPQAYSRERCEMPYSLAALWAMSMEMRRTPHFGPGFSSPAGEIDGPASQFCS